MAICIGIAIKLCTYVQYYSKATYTHTALFLNSAGLLEQLTFATKRYLIEISS